MKTYIVALHTSGNPGLAIIVKVNYNRHNAHDRLNSASREIAKRTHYYSDGRHYYPELYRAEWANGPIMGEHTRTQAEAFALSISLAGTRPGH